MTNRSLLYAILLASSALGTTIHLTTSAQAQTADPTAQTPSQAQTPPAQTPAQPTQLDAVTTSATRNRRPIDAIPGTVSVITTEDIDRDNMQDMRDLVRNEPGVSVGNQPARGGFTNFVIRGIGGNRVVIMADGVRVPDFPGSNAGAGTFTRDFVDLESVKRVEIVRGPMSALYGSDALGGVVAYITKDPSDYLQPGGKDIFWSIKGAYSGEDTSFAESFTVAGRAGNVEALGIYTRRDGHNYWLNDSAVPANPQTWGENNFFAKLVYRPTENDTIRVVGDYYDKILNVQALSNVGDFPNLFARVYDEWGRDRTQRYRLSTEWVHDAPIGFVDRLSFLAYFSSVYRQEDSMQLRGFTGSQWPSNFRVSSLYYSQNIWGAELQLNSDAQLGDSLNHFTYGLSFMYTTTTRPRNRVQVSMNTGAINYFVGGENFANKNFPDTKTVQVGAYVEDEIKIGKLTLTPAVRLDYYGLRTNPDAYFWRSSGAVQLLPSDSTYWSVSPKFGALYHFTDEYSGFFQYGRGFRAPPYDNANFAFSNVTSFYQILPNADLTPETANGFEIGVRGKYRDGSSFALSAFYNLYENFIETTVVGMLGPITQFQYVNLSNVTIWGFEARGEYRILRDLGVLGYFAYAKGTDNSTGDPINSVDPWKASARLRYGGATGWTGQIIATLVGAHDLVSDPTYFKTPGYFTLDATLGYNLDDRVKLNVGAFNITNARYWNSQDVIGVAANSPQLGRYLNPGRYFGANLTMRW